MAKKKDAPSSDIQLLLKAVQQLAKAVEPRTAKEPDGPDAGKRAVPPPTEYAATAARLALIEAAAKDDLAELARKVAQATQLELGGLRDSVQALRTTRGDHDVRRRELAEAAQGYDWTMVHKDRVDHLGPFTFDHAPEGSRILLGKTRLRALEYPSGLELFEAAKQERTRLEAAAKAVWPALKDKIGAAQGPSGLASWDQVTKAFEFKDAGFKKVEAAVVYALTLLRAGRLEEGWSLSTAPPTLQQQPRSLSLPRMDRPGAPDRIYGLRIEGPQTPH